MLHHVVPLQQFHPGVQHRALRPAARSGFLRTSAGHQLLAVFRRAEVTIQHALFFGLRRHPRLAQEFISDAEHGLESIRIALIVAQHYVMFGIQIIVAAVFGEQQAIHEQLILRRFLFAEQRAPHLAQRLLLDIAQGLEQVLAGPAQHHFLVHLKMGEQVAQHHRLALVALPPRPFKDLQPRPAALQHLIELQRHFVAQKLDDRQSHQ